MIMAPVQCEENSPELYSRIESIVDYKDGDIPSEWKEKTDNIKTVLESGEEDSFQRLRILSRSKGGLVCDSLRRKVWPKLIGISDRDLNLFETVDDMEKHRDYVQVVMDVNRTLKRFPPGISDDERQMLQEQLTAVIITVLSRHSEFHYYQGYHDVGLTLLLVLGQRVCGAALERLSQTHLRDFLSPTMEKTNRLLHFVYPILRHHRPQLYQFLVKAELGTMFCLSWLITWFGHVLDDFRTVVRLFDYFLASPPLSPLYLTAAIVLHREADILTEECDMAMQHALLSNVSKDLPFETLLEDATKLYKMYPPKRIEKEVNAVLRARGFAPFPPKKRDGPYILGVPVQQVIFWGVIAVFSYGVYSYWRLNRDGFVR